MQFSHPQCLGDTLEASLLYHGMLHVALPVLGRKKVSGHNFAEGGVWRQAHHPRQTGDNVFRQMLGDLSVQLTQARCVSYYVRNHEYPRVCLHEYQQDYLEAPGFVCLGRRGRRGAATEVFQVDAIATALS